jgi:hypothetical protein
LGKNFCLLLCFNRSQDDDEIIFIHGSIFFAYALLKNTMTALARQIKESYLFSRLNSGIGMHFLLRTILQQFCNDMERQIFHSKIAKKSQVFLASLIHRYRLAKI